jgi:haloalkane dehalogenase
LSGQSAAVEISRHFLSVAGRRVHYRRCGRGPALLMVHQSPRSSAEYEPLLWRWGEHFTCIAPDTPGFGESDPLPDADADIDAFADALVAFLDAAGLPLVGAYGFHSGGIILLAALRRQPRRFTAVAVGGYAVWTPEERALFADGYLPPFRPQPYGEHLTWLWNRVLEQTWFFPWFAAEPAMRLSVAHDDPARVDATVRDMLASGDAYRVGYGAVLAAPRDVPPPDAETPPVLITAYDGDPLQAHLERLGTLPRTWRAHPVATPIEHQDASLAFLKAHPAPVAERIAESAEEGFTRVRAGDYAGLIHWRGPLASARIVAPGSSAALADGAAIDPPGHGLSDPWPGEPPTTPDPWRAALTTVSEDPRWPAPPQGEPARLFPDLAPDRFGAYLNRAWSIVRARHLFRPWYEVGAATALPFDPADLAPERLAREHRALIQAGPAARAFATALQSQQGDAHVDP